MISGSSALQIMAMPAILASASRPAPFLSNQETTGGVSATRRLKGYDYLGCYADDPDDRVFTFEADSADMVPQLCFAACLEYDAALFAVQYGRECWCSTDAQADYERHGLSTCDHPCAGNEEVICGGYSSFDVYKIDLPEPPTGPEYVGCFADNATDRAFENKARSQLMTQEVCREHCIGKHGEELEYYATQYANECWCGTSTALSDYDRHGEGFCHSPCAGDPETSCGGYYAFDLFVHTDVGSSSTSSSPTFTAETSSASVSPSGTTVDPSGPTEDSDEMAKLFELHNAARCVHDTDPLVWSEDVVITAKAYTDELASLDYCGTMDINDSSGLGRNMHVCASSDSTLPCFTAEAAMNEFYDSEVFGGPPSQYGPHAKQVLWKSTTDVGCAVSTCKNDEMYYDIVVCHYAPPAEEDGTDEDNLEYQLKGFQECGY